MTWRYETYAAESDGVLVKGEHHIIRIVLG